MEEEVQPTHVTRWRLTHWFPSQDDSKELKSEHMMTCRQRGHTLVLESEPDKRGAYVLIRLRVEDQVASGSWNQTAESESKVSKTEYSGAGQLIISDDGEKMTGLWAGAGMDRAIGQLRMYTGKWELVHVPDKPTVVKTDPHL